MRPGQAQRLAELVLPRRDALPGAGIDQVEGVSREDVTRERDCGDRFVSTVTAAEKPQRRRIERLHTQGQAVDRKSTRLNSSHRCISYAVFCLKKKKIILQCHQQKILRVVAQESALAR